MKILVDLLLFDGHRGGIETYARHILTRLHDTLPDAELVGLTGRAGVDIVKRFFPGDVVSVPWVRSDRATWAAGELFAVNRYARRHGADVIWSPGNFGPVARRMPLVLTFHDTTYQHLHTGFVQRFIQWTAWKMMRRSGRIADTLITGSYAARSDIVAALGIPTERIHVIPHGASDPHPVEDPWTHLDALGVGRDRPIVMSTGNRLPHKNFAGLLRAIAAIPRSERPLTVIPGAHGEDPLLPIVFALGLENDVILPGWVTLEQLESLYAVASLYVCPSLNEGFGLPVVDAMKRGCIVLANDIAVLREVGGDSARYSDVTDPAQFGSAITGCLRDRNTSDRLREGRSWASQFTWDASAAGTGQVLAEACRTLD